MGQAETVCIRLPTARDIQLLGKLVTSGAFESENLNLYTSQHT